MVVIVVIIILRVNFSCLKIDNFIIFLVLHRSSTTIIISVVCRSRGSNRSVSAKTTKTPSCELLLTTESGAPESEAKLKKKKKPCNEYKYNNLTLVVVLGSAMKCISVPPPSVLKIFRCGRHLFIGSVYFRPSIPGEVS